MPTARSLIAGLALALTAVSCTDKGPTAPDTNKLDQKPSAAIGTTASGLVFRAVTGVVQGGGTFVGTVRITNIVQDGTSLVASGTVSGIIRDASGTVRRITDTFTTNLLTLAQPNAVCDILNLDLGPLHLDLLGLVIDLSELHLDITAVSGPGNLLGNLLCALVGLFDLLDPTAAAQTLSNINAIL